MTEFDHVGVHCATCNLRDFLPFHCYVCQKKYCLEHRSDHGCKQAAQGPHLMPSSSLVQQQQLAAWLPLCPLCGLGVELTTGRDPDAAVSAHIEAGCPQPPKPEKLCTFKGCKLRTSSFSTFSTCPDCHSLFCLTHRHGRDHVCPAIQKAPEKSAVPRKPSASLSPTSSSSASESQTIALQRKAASGSKAAAVVLKSKFRAKAVGNSSIPQTERFYLDVTFPTNCSRVSSAHMYFKQTATVGRIIDEISEYGRIKNNNDKDISNPLQLYDLNTGTALNPDLSLIRSGLRSYSPVLLEYKKQVEQQCQQSSMSVPQPSSAPAISVQA